MTRGTEAGKAAHEISGLERSWVAFIRIFFGLMWLYEATLGHNWKLGNPKWQGAGAGEWLRQNFTEGVATDMWGWAAFLYETTVLPYAIFWSYAVTVFQLVIGVSFVIGLLTRPVAALGLAHMSFMFISGHSRIPPFFAVGFLVVLATDAGLHYGLDRWLLGKISRVPSLIGRVGTWTLRLTFPDGWRRYVAKPLLIGGALYFMLQTSVAPDRFRLVSLDMSVLMAGGAFGMIYYKSMTRTALVGRLVSAFVGYKFLHEIWVRAVPALNGLPGWADGEKLAVPFRLVAEHHFAVFGNLTEALVLPAAGLWAFVFGIVQLSVGVMLVLGWQSRWAGRIGIGYLFLLLLFGFTRYTPFILGLLVFAQAIGAEGWIGLDRTFPRDHRYREPTTFSWGWLAALTVIALAGLGIALSHGIIPGDYRVRMGAVVGAMVAILAWPLVAVALFQRFGRASNIRRPLV